MRGCFQAGLILATGLLMLLIAPGAAALAQLSGSVESVGFGGYCRPDCWTPMVIVVNPQTTKTDFYEVHVKLQDLDRDLPIFTRTISVTGAAEGTSRQQKFRMYFVPPPTDGGLPDASDPGALRELQDRLKVSLHTSPGGRWVCDLPLTGTLFNLDPKPGPWSHRRGAKLVLSVSQTNEKAIYPDSSVTPLAGVMEDMKVVGVQPFDLPENVLGYEAVDAIIWHDADPASLRAGGDERLRAIEAWVRRGGRLVICQPTEWQQTLGFGQLLPVTILGVEQKDDLMPLRALSRPRPGTAPLEDSAAGASGDPFASVKPPFRFARATPRPGAIVEQWITWNSAADLSPYLVRMPLGLGSVTWVAQDLGDSMFVRTPRWVWANVWDRIFDWKNSPLVLSDATPEELKRTWNNGSVMDVGKSLLGGMDLSSKSAWLITLAVVFFIGYWILAGPGTFTYLAAKRRSHLNWFAFALCAVAATALTVLMVRLVLRGPPELRHFSVVKIAPDQPAVVISRLGLYIPRDGPQRIELKDTAPDHVSTITALPIHPRYLTRAPEQNGPEYTVPVMDVTSAQPASIRVPYRSTLKKFQACWIGNTQRAVQGSGRLLDPAQGYIEGRITNGTGQDLRNIYIAFAYPGTGFNAGDWVLYLPEWKDGVTLELNREFNRSEDGGTLPMIFTDSRPMDGRRKVRARLHDDWHRYWLSELRGNPLVDSFDDSARPLRKSLPMLSFYDRLPPVRNERDARENRIELLRRGARYLDVSQSLAAGALVVLAEAPGPLPFVLEVQGDPVSGQGTNFYQFVLPLDRSAISGPPTTQPEDSQ